MWEMVPNCSFKTNRESRRILKMADFIKSLYVFAWCSACNHHQISTCECLLTGQSHIAQLLDVQRTLQIECSRFLKLLWSIPLLIWTILKLNAHVQQIYHKIIDCPPPKELWASDYYVTIYSGLWTWIWCQDNQWSYIHCSWNLV